MSSVNKAVILGNLGADPDIRRTQDGRPIANFSVATSARWTDKETGEKKERTTWHRVVIFTEGLAKVAEQYLKKGSKVYLEGQMQTRKWTDDAGVDRYVTEVVLQGFNSVLVMLDSQGGGGVPPAQGESDYGQARARPQASSAPAFEPSGDDDIPF